MTPRLAAEGADFPSAVDTPIEDDRVVSYLKTAGIDLTEDAATWRAGATLSSSRTQQGARPTPWRNSTPRASAQLDELHARRDRRDRAARVAGRGDRRRHGQRALLGQLRHRRRQRLRRARPRSSQSFDNVKVRFVSDRQAGGYRQPHAGGSRCPTATAAGRRYRTSPRRRRSPRPKFNEALFATVTTDQRPGRVHERPGLWTAISEIQVFDSGRDVPPVANHRAVVTARGRPADGNLSTRLVATATDDGIPDDGELTFGWETVSAPAGRGRHLRRRRRAHHPGDRHRRRRRTCSASAPTDGELTDHEATSR